MKIVDLKCPNCSSSIKADVNNKTATCEYCGSSFEIDDESLNINVKYVNQEEAGYQFEKGRQRARTEAEPVIINITSTPVTPKKRKTWLWVLGWMFIFPIPLTILMLNSPRTKNLNPKIRVAISIVGWLVYFAIGLSGYSTDATDTNMNGTAEAGSSEQVQAANRGGYANIDVFIEKFNATSGMTITDTIEVDNVSDKTSGYYRTVYRLSAFEDAVAIIGNIDGFGQIDIVSYGNLGRYTDIRVYADVQSKEQAALLFEKIANILVASEYKENIPKCIEEINSSNGSVSSLYLGAKYSAGYAYGEVFIEANGVGFD